MKTLNLEPRYIVNTELNAYFPRQILVIELENTEQFQDRINDLLIDLYQLKGIRYVDNMACCIAKSLFNLSLKYNKQESPIVYNNYSYYEARCDFKESKIEIGKNLFCDEWQLDFSYKRPNDDWRLMFSFKIKSRFIREHDFDLMQNVLNTTLTLNEIHKERPYRLYKD